MAQRRVRVRAALAAAMLLVGLSACVTEPVTDSPSASASTPGAPGVDGPTALDPPPSAGAPSSASPTAPNSTAPTSTAPATAAPSAGPRPGSPTTPGAVAGAPPGGGASGTLSGLDLPRIPWEGPNYWARFRIPQAAGWGNPGFFPILIWFSGISSDDEVLWDKAHGFNTYIGQADNTPYELFARNGVFYIGDPLNSSFTSSGVQWVGRFLGDEVDGYGDPRGELAAMRSRRASYPADGRLNYANYTQLVGTTYYDQSLARAFLDVPDVNSVDMYWYTIPFCDWRPFQGDSYVVPVRSATCRTASSYGAMTASVRAQDAATGAVHPYWNFIELYNGGAGDMGFVRAIRPGELRGAVMSSIIHEARGLVYFNSSLNGPCSGANLLRRAQLEAGFCAAAQVEAAGVVNNQVHALAHVINTQSYAHTFGPGLDTMLKVADGSAYVFAMIDGSAVPGPRTFTVPPQLRGRQVEVLFEGRTLTMTAAGQFVDTFAAEYSYHIYRIR